MRRIRRVLRPTRDKALVGLALLAAATAGLVGYGLYEDWAEERNEQEAAAQVPDLDYLPEAQPASAHPELSARVNGEQVTEAEHPHDPVQLSIPRIDVESPLVRLGLTRDRAMEVPEDFSLAGWYVHGPQPGDPGPAIIAGHISSTAGPGIFFRLDELTPGDEVHITRDDGEELTFVVDRREQYRKDELPPDEVWSAHGPQLRLITCGGPFDAHEGRHRDNLVVFASLSEESQQARGSDRDAALSAVQLLRR